MSVANPSVLPHAKPRRRTIPSPACGRGVGERAVDSTTPLRFAQNDAFFHAEARSREEELKAPSPACGGRLGWGPLIGRGERSEPQRVFLTRRCVLKPPFERGCPPKAGGGLLSVDCASLIHPTPKSLRPTRWIASSLSLLAMSSFLCDLFG
jgi:hypothetical protein